MDELISRRAAIKYLMDNMTWYSEDGYETDEDEKKSAITSLINGVPSIQPVTGKWIPVSERLPEDGDRVLVTYDKIVIRATWDLMRYRFYDTHAVSLDKDFVYAWMHLPEPYEPQESDHKCHSCKHYISGERDGSCGSYICKHYSDWESER